MSTLDAMDAQIKALEEQIKREEEGAKQPEAAAAEATPAGTPEEPRAEESPKEEPEEHADPKEEELGEEEGTPKNSYGRLKYELKKERQERERQAIEVAELRGRLEEQSKIVATQQIIQKQEQPEEVIPDPTYDKEAYLEYQLKKQEEKIKKLEEATQAVTTNNAITNAQRALQKLEANFSKDNTDYSGAKEFLRGQLAMELKLENPKASDSQIEAIIDQQELNAAANVAGRNQNPAEYFYNLAKVRGYTGQKPPTGKKDTVADFAKAKENKERSVGFVGTPSIGKDPVLPTDMAVKMDWRTLNTMTDHEFKQMLNNAQKQQKNF
jgi:hypothetical protein